MTTSVHLKIHFGAATSVHINEFILHLFSASCTWNKNYWNLYIQSAKLKFGYLGFTEALACSFRRSLDWGWGLESKISQSASTIFMTSKNQWLSTVSWTGIYICMDVEWFNMLSKKKNNNTTTTLKICKLHLTCLHRCSRPWYLRRPHFVIVVDINCKSPSLDPAFSAASWYKCQCTRNKLVVIQYNRLTLVCCVQYGVQIIPRSLMEGTNNHNQNQTGMLLKCWWPGYSVNN